ncbi:MAG: DUF503 domain-containing protein [Acidimicrobiales bacterium]
MHIGALTVEIHIAESRSLKAKRSVIRHLLDTSRRRYGVAAAEVGFHDLWQRAELCFAAVAKDAGHVEDVLDSVERFVWSHPEIEVSAAGRHWLEIDR